MNNNGRSEARSVILRLRRYRDRMQEIVTTATGAPEKEGSAAITVRRKIRSLKADLDNDAHECVIGRKRMVQTECEHDFLWPALREAADAIREHPAPATTGSPSQAELCSAQGRIQHYLNVLEGRWPTL